MLEYQQIENNWSKIKKQILNQWDQLSDAEVEQTHGNANSLAKLVERIYGPNKNFDSDYEKLCLNVLKNLTQANSSVALKSMDKDRDDQYLAGPNGVTRPLESSTMEDLSKNTIGEDGFNNADRHSNTKLNTKDSNINKTIPDEVPPNHAPGNDLDITERGSNFSANTTSISALNHPE